MKVNLDWVNVWLIGEETEQEALDLLGPDIRYVHLKNGRPTGNGDLFPTALSDGIVNTYNHLRDIRRCGFDGIIVPEFSKGGDGRYFARRDLQYLKDVLSALERDT